MNEITITLNGAPQRIAANSTLADFVTATGEPPEALATAVNGEFVARTQRSSRELREGDAIFTFQPITGG